MDDISSSELVKHSETSDLPTLLEGDLERFFRFQKRFDFTDAGIILLLFMP